MSELNKILGIDGEIQGIDEGKVLDGLNLREYCDNGYEQFRNGLGLILKAANAKEKSTAVISEDVALEVEGLSHKEVLETLALVEYLFGIYEDEYNDEVFDLKARYKFFYSWYDAVITAYYAGTGVVYQIVALDKITSTPDEERSYVEEIKEELLDEAMMIGEMKLLLPKDKQFVVASMERRLALNIPQSPTELNHEVCCPSCGGYKIILTTIRDGEAVDLYLDKCPECGKTIYWKAE